MYRSLINLYICIFVSDLYILGPLFYKPRSSRNFLAAFSSSRSRYFIRRCRSWTFLIRPRREEKSFLCCFKWSVKSSTSADKMAICTCGEPVSDAWVRNFSMIFCFFFGSNIKKMSRHVRVSGIKAPKAQAPSFELCPYNSKTAGFRQRWVDL